MPPRDRPRDLHGPSLLTVQEVADLYRVSESTVRRWADRGAVERIKVGGTVRIRIEGRQQDDSPRER